MKKILFYSVLFASHSAFAALSPLNESIAEIKAILNHKDLRYSLKTNEAIEEILRTDDGYLVKTEHYQVPVKVTYLHSNGPGPQKFQLNFSEPAPIEVGSPIPADEEN